MRRRRIAVGVAAFTVVVLAVAALAVLPVSSTSASAGNVFAAGTVSVSDNDSGAAGLSLSSALPGNSDTSCIRVTYGGSLDAALRLYADVSGGLAPYLSLTVTRGTDASPAYDSCASFTPDGTNYQGAGPGVVYSGLLSAYPTSYDAGVVDPPTGPVETWTAGEARSYKLTVTLGEDPAAQGLSASATFRWEARNL
jgi:hypothetical protein